MIPFGGLPGPHTFLVADFGLYMELARRLAEDGHRVLYFTPYVNKFPRFTDYAIGLGMPGIEKPRYFWRELEQLDPAETTIMFPEVGFGDLAVHLRQLGWSVFGAGRGDMLEDSRETLKQVMEAAGLPVQPYAMIKGVAALRDYLAEHRDVFVKLDIFRGDMDSFAAQDPAQTALLLTRIEAAWGPFADEYLFLVEDMVGKRETGFDALFGAGDWLRPYIWGVEIHKGCYAGTVNPRVPPSVARVAAGLIPALQALDYRGFCSTEIRVEADGTPYLIDLCARAPSPLGVGFPALIENFSELVYAVARNEPVAPQYRGRYFLTLPMGSEEAEKFWVALNFEDADAGNVRFRLAARTGGRTYALPGLTGVMVLVAVGEDLDAMHDEMVALTGRVSAIALEADISELEHSIAELRALEAEAVDVPTPGRAEALAHA